VLTLPSGAWEKGARRAALMAARGGVLTRARGGLLPFIGGRRWPRWFASQVYGTGAGYGGVHGRVRRRRDWAGGGMVGTAWPRHAQHVGQGDGAWMAVLRKGRGPRRANRRTEHSRGAARCATPACVGAVGSKRISFSYV
jgi:hypothetical protein